jgi:exo-1,4-beta-D-glucosaminidase
VKDVDLDAGEVQTVDFTGDDYPQLVFAQPALWWPWQYGEPILHELALELLVDGQTSDRLTTRFGMRQVTSHLDDQGHAVFEVNGRPILIRGAAWAPDMFQRRPPDRQLAELRYARDLNLNAIRLEGKFEDDRFFDLADEEGLLILIGWCCCDAWADQNGWRAEQHVVATESLKTQMRRLRNHPSMLLWMNGSDNPPTVPGVEAEFLETEADLRWPNAITSHAAGLHSDVSGETGLKMLGPYDWVPPVYWEGRHRSRRRLRIREPRSAPGRRSRRSPASSACSRTNTSGRWTRSGRSMAGWITTRTSTPSQRPSPAATAPPPRWPTTPASAGDGIRVASRDVRGLRAQQVPIGDRRHPVDAQQPLAVDDLAPLRLLPAARGSYFGAKKALEPLHVQYSYVDDAVVVVNSQARDSHGCSQRRTSTICAGTAPAATAPRSTSGRMKR